jgi:hypothetical protein
VPSGRPAVTHFNFPRYMTELARAIANALYN